MIASAFVELLVAGCLTEREELRDGRPTRVYRAAPDIDLDLLGPIERLLVRWLAVERTLPELLRLAVPASLPAAGETGERESGLSAMEARLLAETGEAIDAALEYLPPACTCSI